jgi:hypothetical protein
VRSTVLLVMAAVITVSTCGIAVRLAWVELGSRHSAYAQTKGTCPNPQLIDTFEGNDDQQSDTFNTTTDSFRVSWQTTNTLGAGAEGSLYIGVIDANDPNALPATTASQEGTGTGETFVNAPPGSYFLDIIAGGLDYTITVEQCEGGDPSRNPGKPSPGSTSSPTASPTAAASPTPSAPTKKPLIESGGPPKGPVPLMLDGSCPKEYPEQRGGACYR